MIALCYRTETAILVLVLLALPPWLSSWRTTENQRLQGLEPDSSSAGSTLVIHDFPQQFNRFNRAIYQLNASQNLTAAEEDWLKKQSCAVQCVAKLKKDAMVKQRGNPFTCAGKIYAGENCAIASTCKKECEGQKFSCEDFYYNYQPCMTKQKTGQLSTRLAKAQSFLGLRPRLRKDTDACIVGSTKGVQGNTICQRSDDKEDAEQRWERLYVQLYRLMKTHNKQTDAPYEPDEDKLDELTDAVYSKRFESGVAPLGVDAFAPLETGSISEEAFGPLDAFETSPLNLEWQRPPKPLKRKDNPLAASSSTASTDAGAVAASVVLPSLSRVVSAQAMHAGKLKRARHNVEARQEQDFQAAWHENRDKRPLAAPPVSAKDRIDALRRRVLESPSDA